MFVTLNNLSYPRTLSPEITSARVPNS